MLPERRDHVLVRLIPLASYTLLLFACVLVAIGLGGCPEKQLSPPAVDLEGIPTLRVRLTAGSVRSGLFSSTGPFRLYIDARDETPAGGASAATELKISRRGGQWYFGGVAHLGERLSLRAASRSLLNYNGRSYRRMLELVPSGAESYHVVNHIDIESYLAGVLPRELYADWSPETYRALAVAARTYALYKKSVYGRGRYFDVMSGQSDQVYGAFAAETDKSWDAVRSTHAWVLTFGTPGSERIFMTQYSASNGGFVNAASVIRNAADIEPLRGGQRDPDGPFYPRFKWGPVKISKADILRAVAGSYDDVRDWKELREIRVVKRTSYGRSVWVDLLSDTGKSIRIRSEDLRLVLLRSRATIPAAGKIRSMNCRLRDTGKDIEFYNGRGFGHGVGLSQWGAEAKAQKGWSAERILEFYYPGSKIFRAY